jgi:hypothetical protein
VTPSQALKHIVTLVEAGLKDDTQRKVFVTWRGRSCPEGSRRGTGWCGGMRAQCSDVSYAVGSGPSPCSGHAFGSQEIGQPCEALSQVQKPAQQRERGSHSRHEGVKRHIQRVDKPRRLIGEPHLAIQLLAE